MPQRNDAALDFLHSRRSRPAKTLIAPAPTREDLMPARSQFDLGQLAVVVVEIQKDSPKIPPLEMTYSAGAVCLALLNAALAAGWGANWLSGWMSHDRGFCKAAFDLAEDERIAGLIHIATEGAVPPERPRPDVDAITTWVET